MQNRERTCCFTGHRAVPREAEQALAERLTDTVDRLIGEGVRYFGCGGAIGFDLLAAEAVLRLRAREPGIRLILVLPCPGHTKSWRAADVERFQAVLRRADKCVCLSDHYYRGCMQARNRWLVDFSGTCVCYLTREEGGTAYTVQYAREQGLAVINLAG